MKNYLRVLRMALAHRVLVAGLISSSLAVALLWGGNIGALYPFVEIVFEGRTLHDWVRQELADSAKLVKQRAAEYELAERESPAEADVLKVRLEAERKRMAFAQHVEPYIERYAPRTPFGTLLALVGVVILATVVKDTLIVANSLLVNKLTENVTLELRETFYGHALRMDLAGIGKEGTGKMMSRFNVDIKTMTIGLSACFGVLVREPLKMVACLAGAALISWRLLLISMILAPAAGLAIRWLSSAVKRANHRSMDEMARLYQRLNETFVGIRTVQAFTMERYEHDRLGKIARACRRTSSKIAWYSSLIKPITEVLGISMICIALIAGAYLVVNQETHIFGVRMTDRPISMGSLLVFYGLLIGASDPARRLTEIYNYVQSGIAASDRVLPFLDRKSAIVDRPDPQRIPRPIQAIEFKNLHFRYQDEPIFQGLNLRIERGQTVVIVGPNGCGKSTLINLLLRFHDPQQGSVLFDGVDLRDVRLKELRGRMGIVSQQHSLFNATVRENIAYGSLDATNEQIIAAAKQAYAHDFIMERLDDGYDTVVGEGGERLSGGQRQRIALARAILRDPEILILDEATSQIDLQSEQLIHAALEQFIVGRTAIIVTHRLSTLDLADRILVLNHGEIIDDGTHRELIARCDFYRRLHDSQIERAA